MSINIGVQIQGIRAAGDQQSTLVAEALESITNLLKDIQNTLSSTNPVFVEPDDAGNVGQPLVSGGPGSPSTWGMQQLTGLANGLLFLTAGVMNDIPGCTVTLNRIGTYLIVGMFTIFVDPGSVEVDCQLVVGGVQFGDRLTAQANTGAGTSIDIPGVHVWAVPVTTNTIAKLQAQKTNAAGAALINQPGTGILALFIG